MSELHETTGEELEAAVNSNRESYEEYCRHQSAELGQLKEMTFESIKELQKESEEKLSAALKEVFAVENEIKELRNKYAENLLSQENAHDKYELSLEQLRASHEAENASIEVKLNAFENKLSELNLNYGRNLELSVLGAKHEIESLLSGGKNRLSESVERANEELNELLESNKSDCDLVKKLYKDFEED